MADILVHTRVARETIHWFQSSTGRWLTCPDDEQSCGWDANGESVTAGPWTPWSCAFKDEHRPFVRWFEGGQTNAAFNEVDRHVLSGHGHEVAAIEFEEEGGRRQLTRDELLLESAVRACELQRLGLVQGDRVLIHMSNTLEQLLWIEACKRQGIVLSATAIDQPAETLKARLLDLDAHVVLTRAKSAAEKMRGIQGIQVNVVETEHLGLDAHRQRMHTSGTPVDWVRIAAECPAVPVDANFPLFVSYTSGSTGAPKGIVHVHGYTAGVAHTMQAVFGAVPGKDTIFVVANPGWITGQSYMITGALTTRTTTVIMEGSATVPSVLRFADIITQAKATIFKAGSTFIRHIATSSGLIEELDAFKLPEQLRVATFCAEPVNKMCHEFAAKHICGRYLNSYWGTEHGGIVWSILDPDSQGLVPDAHTQCLPWITGDVDAPTGETSDILINEPYPYQARTVWGDSANVMDASWRGNEERWASYFDAKGRFVQGDTAMRHEDGSYTFHGRSDEVMNIGGNRYGNEQIENAVLQGLGGLVRNAVVVGVDDELSGTAPVAVIVPHDADSWDADSCSRRIRQAVIQQVGQIAVPQRIVLVSDIPRTFSGKYMRRLLAQLLTGKQISAQDPLMDTVVNKECLPKLIEELSKRPSTSQDREGYVAPRNRAEHDMCAAWAEALGLDRVGVFDEFQALGGHSMTAMRIGARTGANPAFILKHGTVAAVIAASAQATSRAADVSPVAETTLGSFNLFGKAVDTFVQRWLFTRIPAKWLQASTLSELVHLKIPLPGLAKDARGRLEQLFRIHPILTARTRFPSITLHISQSVDDVSSHILEGCEVSEVMAGIQGLWDRPLCVGVIGEQETALVLHHLLYDARSLNVLYQTWQAIVRGEVPERTNIAVYEPLEASLCELLDVPFCGDTGFEVFPTLYGFAKDVKAAPTADTNPWDLIKGITDRAIKAYKTTSTGPIYVSVIYDCRTEFAESNTINVCGYIVVRRMYRYDGTTFHKLDSVECDGKPMLQLNIFERDFDLFALRPAAAVETVCTPLSRFCQITFEPSATVWSCPRELLPEELQAGLPPSPPIPLMLTTVCAVWKAVLPRSLLALVFFVGLFPWKLIQNLTMLGLALLMGAYLSNPL